MEKIIITCKNCDASLTNQLKKIKLDLSLFEEDEEIIERGFWSEGHEDVSISHNDRILINWRDSKLINHKLIKNYFGCCGYEPVDFLNQICPNCKIGIATIVNECYTYDYVAIKVENVKVK
ncbi:hypothetical protein [uncultured Lacinutrix sp.]|uniref:hypothetical protein n=1 Tax=uncultured Lacinutrix sp. TaxID=574032 RepID=UPI00261EF34A|nr:hypothetical protein [uncultured Lacinutrix sp.]